MQVWESECVRVSKYGQSVKAPPLPLVEINKISILFLFNKNVCV